MSDSIAVRDANNVTQQVRTTLNGGLHTPHQNATPLVAGNPVDGANPLPVTGPATDAQLRATPLPILEPATVLTGQANQTAIVNNVLDPVAGPNGTVVENLRSASVQVVSTGTGGTFIFEQSNDGVNWSPLPVFNAALLTGVPIVAAITATASAIIYSIPLRCRQLRLRIVSAITGGTIQAFSRLSSEPFTPAVATVAQPTAANLAVTVGAALPVGTNSIGNLGTVASVTAANLNAPVVANDVASAALTTTTTTAAFTPTSGVCYEVNIPVTAVTGTTPTLDVSIEESDDSGTNWFKVYDFPRITATGIYRSPKLPITGNRVRYVQTVGGTTPSFTRAINRQQGSDAPLYLRQSIDRSLAVNTLNSTGASLVTSNCRSAQVVLALGAATTPPAIQMEGSDDNGASWYAVGAPLTGVASSTVQLTVANVNSQLLRARVSTAGSGATLNSLTLKGF